MIKEIFDIDPKQKNILIIVVSVFGLSFLQLFLFKRSIIDLGIIYCIGISIGLTVCWSILSIPPLALFFEAVTPKKDDEATFNFEIVFFTLGLLALGWIILYTFISYELNLNFKWLIRIAISSSIIRSIFWWLIILIKENRLKKSKK